MFFVLGNFFFDQFVQLLESLLDKIFFDKLF